MTRLLSAALAAIALAVLGAGTASAAPSGAGDPSRRLQLLIEQDFQAAQGAIPGRVVTVLSRSRGLDWTGSVGFADVQTGRPLVPRDPFRLASVTKTYTSAAVLRLVERGKISLDQTIDTLLPPVFLRTLRAGGYRPDQITVRHLLAHTSGLYDFATDPAYFQAVFSSPRKRWSRLEQVRFAMRHGRPLGAPGAAYHYSDTGYSLLGEIIADVTGRAYSNAYRALLRFHELGLKHTWFETLDAPPPDTRPLAHQYYGTTDFAGWDPSFDLWGAGGIVSTSHDLALFFRALNRGRVFARPSTLQTMRTIAPVPRDEPGALGIIRFDVAGEACWGHGGFWGIFAMDCPASDVTITWAYNQGNVAPPYNPNVLVIALLEAVRGA
jgi:D-alanyl-D-alanine carboxypeptidase